MSFFPTIIIKLSDLQKHSELLENSWEYEHDEKLNRVLIFLKDALKTRNVFEIDGIKMILCQPDFSLFNQEVRDKLSELGVQYAISN